MKTCTLSINNKSITVEAGTTLLEAAKKAGYFIPTLCNHPDQEIKANCRICVVEDKTAGKFVTSCSTMVYDGAEIFTNTAEVRELQAGILELILANHPNDCLNCIRNESCELRQLCERFHIRNFNLESDIDVYPIDNTSGVLVRDRNKCIKCMRCVEACQETQMVGVLSPSYRSINTCISAGFDENYLWTMLSSVSRWSNL
jgi:NADH dehydrogenase/NADH:ubiquinone oxidoreductase subunit G